MNYKAIEEFPYVIDEWFKFVKKEPDKIFILDETNPAGYSRKTIDEEASMVYGYLKKLGLGREDFVMIRLPRGRKIFSAMLGIWKAGAALTIVDEHYAPERIEFIYKDCGCKFVISEENWDEVMTGEELPGHEPVYNHDACFAVYTSGSTGMPKGVLHEYGKLSYSQMTSIPTERPNWDDQSIIGVVSPLNFVAAVKLGVCGFYEGYTMDIIPIETVKNPVKLKKIFLDHKITHTFFSPSIIRATGGNFGPYLKQVITGSEPVNGIEFAGAMLINNYGMSEAAFVVAQYIMTGNEDPVPIGKPLCDLVEILLLDDDGNPVEAGKEGEICFENPYFRGYINMPEETGKVLKNGIFHTNDLGIKLPDGNYAVVGRKSEMIKINGNRVEPGEIEAHARQIPGIDWCAVKGFTEAGGSYLCFYYVGDAELNVQELKDKLMAELPYYMVPAYYIKLDEIPLLPNNKVNKKALPKPERTVYREKYVAPTNEMEERLCSVFAKILGRDQVGIKDDFFQMGGDSLNVMRALAEINDDRLEAADFYSGNTAENIARRYYSKAQSNEASEEEFEMNARKGKYKSTALQNTMGMQTFCAGDLINETNVLISLYVIDDKENCEKIKSALETTIKNYSVFATRFEMDENHVLWQSMDESIRPRVTIEKTTEAQFRELLPSLIAPVTDPEETYRFKIFETEDKGYLFINKTHVVSDGMSKVLMLQSMAKAFSGQPLPMDTYYSFLASWNEGQSSQQAAEDRKYYHDKYDGIQWTHDIAADDDACESGCSSEMRPVQLSQRDVDNFQKVSGLSSYYLCLIALMLSIAEHTGKKDILTSYSYNNRSDKVKSNALGLVFKYLPLGIRLGQYATVRDMLDDVKQQTIENVKHNIVDYVPMAQKNGQRIFTTSFETEAILNSDPLTAMGLHEEPVPVQVGRSFSDIMVLLELPGNLMNFFLYDRSVHKAGSMEAFFATYNYYLRKLVSLDAPEIVSMDDFMKE